MRKETRFAERQPRKDRRTSRGGDGSQKVSGQFGDFSVGDTIEEQAARMMDGLRNAKAPVESLLCALDRCVAVHAIVRKHLGPYFPGQEMHWFVLCCRMARNTLDGHASDLTYVSEFLGVPRTTLNGWIDQYEKKGVMRRVKSGRTVELVACDGLLRAWAAAMAEITQGMVPPSETADR